MMLILVCLIIPLGSGWLLAQNRPATAPANPPATAIPFRGYILGDSKSVQIDSGDFIPSSKDYQIGVGDQIELKIGDLKPDADTVKVARMPESGVVTVPVLGPVRLAGLTEADAETAIQNGFKEKHLLENARVSVTIIEATGRTFTIMGSVARPGKYAILDNNFRLFDALALAGGGLKGTNVRILREVEGKPDPRIIDIPGELIGSGDPQVNIVIRRRDYIILTDAKPQASGVPNEAARVVVMPSGIMLDDKLTDWAKVRQKLEAIPQDQRKQAFVGLVAGSTQLTVKDYFDAQAEAEKIVSDLGLGYVSNVGISRKPYDPAQEYYIGGEVERGGVYSMKDRTITLRQAVISAGMLTGAKDPNELKNHPHSASIVRKVDDRHETFLPDVSLADLFDGKTPDVILKPGDQIMVRAQKPAAATAPAGN
jgi:polysaccharide export outer membrane protein